MKQALLKILFLCVGVSVFAAFAVHKVAPGKIDRSFNKVHATNSSSVTVSEEARKLHGNLKIVDWHSDSLLWNRNLLVRNSCGHVDVPRLIEGNVAIQVFTIVTKVPESMNLKSNSGDTDKIVKLALVQGWPPATWTSLAERTLFQADKLAGFAKASRGKLTIIKSVSDLEKYLKRRQSDSGITAGILGIEGAHALDGDLKNLDAFYDRGIRLIGLAHFFDNDIGGSAHGKKKSGLTTKGLGLVRRMQEKGMIIDLAHASSALIKDSLKVATKPVVVSHTGVKGTCDNNRNLSDQQIKEVARTGGVIGIGIGYWSRAVCGSDVESIVKAIRHASRVAGVDHVSLGSDFDGAVTVPFDTSSLVLITDALLKEGFSNEDIAKIMGGNALRVLQETLPEK